MPARVLPDYFQSRKALIDRALEDRLPRATQEPRRVHEAMRYATLSGGKRLRPLLLLAVGELEACAPENLLDAACAIELVHAASLVLDDLPSMDNAPTRRGLPCAHVKYGEAAAILAAFGLVTLAFEFVARNAVALGRPATSAAVVRDLARMVGTGGIIYGQCNDLGMGNHAPTPEQLTSGHEHKAAALFLAAVRVPACLLDFPDKKTQALEHYAHCIGFAFQMADDLVDAQNYPEDQGRITYTVRLGKEEARNRVAELIAEAVGALAPFTDRAAPLRVLAEHVQAQAL